MSAGPVPQVTYFTTDAPPCPDCGQLQVRSGEGYRCVAPSCAGEDGWPTGLVTAPAAPTVPAVPDPAVVARIHKDIERVEELVDSRLLRADEARAEGRWEDCLKWAEEAVSAVRDRKRLSNELRIAKTTQG